MNQEQFEEVFKSFVENSEKVLVLKGREYASATDRLHNFKVSAALQDCTPEQALGGFLAKHIVSIFDLIKMSSEGIIPMDKWDEKLGDALNYIILLKALVTERSWNGRFNEVMEDLKSLGEDRSKYWKCRHCAYAANIMDLDTNCRHCGKYRAS